MSQIRLEFKILLYPEGDWWIAHCLEMDLPAEGQTPNKALRNLFDLVDVQVNVAIEEGDLASIFSPAPAELWRQFATAKDIDKSPGKPRKPISRLSVRELALA